MKKSIRLVLGTCIFIAILLILYSAVHQHIASTIIIEKEDQEKVFITELWEKLDEGQHIDNRSYCLSHQNFPIKVIRLDTRNKGVSYLHLHEIMFLKKEKDNDSFVKLVSCNGITHDVRGTVEKLHRQLNNYLADRYEDFFFLLARDCIVNPMYIERVGRNSVVLKNKQVLPLSVNKQKILLELLDAMHGV